VSSIEHKSESDVSDDPGVEFPVGLWDFDITCTNPGDTADIKIYLDKEYDTTGWTYYKYQSSAYVDLTSIVTFGTATVGADTVTTMEYSIIDGGTYDDDGVANGVIVDPGGPGDATAPIIVSTDPVDDSTVSFASQDLTITFDEGVYPDIGDVHLFLDDDTLIETFSASTLTYGSGSTLVTIDPATNLTK